MQSNYIPWKGYFDLINQVDIFCFLDNVQYTKNDWRNRNKIKTKNGLKWLTIPCGTNIKRLICDIKLDDHSWQKKHWEQIKENYSKAPYFKEKKDFFENFYLNNNWKYLSESNQYLIKNIAKDQLGITNTIFTDSRDYNLKKSKGERVIELLNKIGATEYISGPAAISYIDVELFKKEDIHVKWMNYLDYPEYSQQHPPFEHGVSILDLIFNEGKNASKFMNSFNQ